MVDQELVRRRLKTFQHRCGDYGDKLLRFASHAALPVALNAELVHLLRINFFLDPPETLPYTAESDLLLSSLCREIGDDLYEMEPELRNYLLRDLASKYGSQRIGDLATLLWQYLERRSPWREQVELERSQQLTALNFLSPHKAKQWLDEAEKKAGQITGVEKEWFVVMRRELADLPLVDFFVLKVQKALVQAGFELVVDGFWGSATEQVIREFQNSRDLTADGILGPKTLKLLLSVR